MSRYNADFTTGSWVRVASRAVLERFAQTWQYHHKFEPEQLDYANRRCRVKEVSFYHGGDVLYELYGAPGIWHEQNLRAADAESAG